MRGSEPRLLTYLTWHVWVQERKKNRILLLYGRRRRTEEGEKVRFTAALFLSLSLRNPISSTVTVLYHILEGKEHQKYDEKAYVYSTLQWVHSDYDDDDVN